MFSPALLQRLRAILGSEHLLTEREDLLVYAYDATSMLRTLPEAVALPRSSEQICQLLELAGGGDFKVVPRGSGTGLSGGATPVENCLVLSTQHMNRVLEVDQTNLTATVEPGVITANLHQHVESLGLFYPPDPGSMKICTLGGNVAENAGGLRGLKYGVTRDYIMGLELVLPDGRLMRTGSKCPKDVAGYDLRHILIGSEGTLGVFTKILVKLIPKPAQKQTLLASFPTLQGAAETVAAIIADRIIPATLEFLDRTTIECVEAYARIGLPLDAEAILLMESDGHPAAVVEEAEKMEAHARACGAGQVQRAADAQEALRLSSARRMAFPALARRRPTTVLEDVSVPRSRLVEMVTAVRDIALRHNLEIGTFGHAGDGNLHPTILMDERDGDEVARMHRAFGEIVEKAVELGGTITGEHGVGLLKRDYLPLVTGPAGLEVMERFRQAMDPAQVLNPGKLFTSRPRCEGHLPHNHSACQQRLEELSS